MVTTDGHLLGRRVIYRQPAEGFRSGIEPVLLAASVPVRPGESVLEAGTGCGAALLCLSARVPGVKTTGLELDERSAALASDNARANGFGGIEIIADSIDTGTPLRRFDHAIANPPYHAADGTASPDVRRELAKRGSDALLAIWIERLSGILRDRGSLTLIVPAGMIPACVTAMTSHRCPCTILFPLWPRIGSPAKLILVRGVKHGRTPMRLMPGLILHEADGSFTKAANAVLRDGADLALDGEVTGGG